MRSTISPLFRRLDRRLLDPVGYSDYNLAETGENAYRITLAVPGFSQEEISIEHHENDLRIAGKGASDETTYLVRGFAKRDFQRRFYLPDHIRVEDARLEAGLLHIDLVREVPEALQPKKIEVRSTDVANIDGESSEAA